VFKSTPCVATISAILWTEAAYKTCYDPEAPVVWLYHTFSHFTVTYISQPRRIGTYPVCHWSCLEETATAILTCINDSLTVAFRGSGSGEFGLLAILPRTPIHIPHNTKIKHTKFPYCPFSGIPFTKLLCELLMFYTNFEKATSKPILLDT
jgi:hypothetical protein